MEAAMKKRDEAHASPHIDGSRALGAVELVP